MNKIKSIKDLPERIQGNGLRADEYTAYSTHVNLVLLNDDEFDKVLTHNARIHDGNNKYNSIAIHNDRDFIIIRESAFFQPIKFTPERTAKEEADRLVWLHYDNCTTITNHEAILGAIIDITNTITALKSANVSTVWHEEVLTILKGM